MKDAPMMPSEKARRFYAEMLVRLGRLPPCVPILLLSLFYFGVRACYFDYAPMWDSRGYYNYILDAQSQPWDLLNYNMGGHNSHLWALLIGLPGFFFPRDYHAYNVWGAVLSTTSVAAFYYIVDELCGTFLGHAEKLLITALFAFHPSMFANQLHITADTGLLIFWVWYLLAMLKEKIVLAAVAGCFLLFCKEHGLLHLPILYGFCALRQPPAQRKAWLLKHKAPILFPFGVFFLFLAYKAGLRNQSLFFDGFLQKPSPQIRIFPDASLVTYLLLAFVLNFNWVIMGLIARFTVLLRRRPATAIWKPYKDYMPAMVWLFVATSAVVLGIRHYSNVRYMLPLYAAMFLFFAYVLPVVPYKKWGAGILVLLLCATTAQMFRSIDPVSNHAFCVTDFGRHRVIAVPNFDKICGPGEYYWWLPKDRLLYNLEFLHVQSLIHTILRTIRPDNDTGFALGYGYDYELLDGLDENYHMTFNHVKYTPKIYAIPPMRYMRNKRYIQLLPETLYYIEFPVPYMRVFKRYLFSIYSGAREKTYDENGYQLKVIKLYHKNKGEWCEPL